MIDYVEIPTVSYYHIMINYRKKCVYNTQKYVTIKVQIGHKVDKYNFYLFFLKRLIGNWRQVRCLFFCIFF